MNYITIFDRAILVLEHEIGVWESEAQSAEYDHDATFARTQANRIRASITGLRQFAEGRITLESYQDFAKGILRLANWPEIGDVDAFEIQELAAKFGILEKTTQFKSCCEEACLCAEYHSAEGMSEGVTCYRMPLELQESEPSPPDLEGVAGYVEGVCRSIESVEERIQRETKADAEQPDVRL